MTEVLLFHHAQGLTDGVRSFAGTLARAGHTVHTPDLYDGATFGSLDEGVAHAKELGFDTILDRGVASADHLGKGLVYAGFSLGVMPAQKLAQTRDGARGALLLEGFLPPDEFGAWPAGVPAQVHGRPADEWFAEDYPAAQAFAESTPKAELFTYDGGAHLFADDSLPSYDPASADLLVQRVLAFLARLD